MNRVWVRTRFGLSIIQRTQCSRHASSTSIDLQAHQVEAANSLENVKPRGKLTEILKRVARHGTTWLPDTSTQAWLDERGYSVTDLLQWSKLANARTAEDALGQTQEDLPISLVLKILRKPTTSRKTFYYLVNLYRRSVSRMDITSQFYAIVLLLQRAVRMANGALQLLQTDIEALPHSFTQDHFNHLLQVVAASRSGRIETDNMSRLIVSVMQSRDMPLDRRGYQALLDSSIHDLKRFMAIQDGMIAAGYSLDDSEREFLVDRMTSPPGLVDQDYQTMLAKVASAPTIIDCFRAMKRSGERLDPQLAFGISLTHYRDPREALTYCLRLAKMDKIRLSSILTRLLLKACNFSQDRSHIDAVMGVALDQGVKISSSIWVEYLKRLISAQATEEVVDILVSEPGGNNLLDMHPDVRRDPDVWTVVLEALHGLVRYKHIPPAQHATYMSQILQGLQKHKVVFDKYLLWRLCEGAIYSGPRQWNGVHSCDAVVKYFAQEVDLGQEPWKLQPTNILWQTYFTVLLMNEETQLMSEAMMSLLSTGTPSRRVLTIFALGMWESGSIESVEYWRSYFEDELKVAWPDQEAAFSVRNTLKLQAFYD